MIFEMQEVKNKKLSKAYEDSMEELDSFFELNWKYKRPNLIIVPDRKTIDALRGEKTEDWVVGWADGNAVYLLSDKNYEIESCHKYSDKEYFALLKHELAHCFSRIASNFAQSPVWLFEGISIFLSGQNELKAKPKKLENFIEFYDKSGKEVYRESGFAVEFLFKEYGKKSLINMLKKSKEAGSSEDFAKLFRSIYGFELAYENFKIL
jgi:hypothetical protein